MFKDFNALKLTLASSQQVLSWSHGEVKKAETINYRTQRAEVDGLMCEKIFGPTTNYQCYCGKYKKVRYKGIICDKCGVEVTHNRVRRERMGHIKLASPIVHIWYSHGIPNKLSLILDVPKKKIESVIYFARYAITAVDVQKQKDVKKEVEKKRDQDVKDLQNDLKNEIAAVSKSYEDERKKLEKKGNKGLEIESQRQREEKEIAKLRELYARKENKVKIKYNELIKLIGNIAIGEVLSEEQHADLQDVGADFYELQMGADAVKKLLSLLDIDQEIKDLKKAREETRSKVKERKIVSRLRILEGLQRNKIDPRWIIMEAVPVIPPALRPIIQLPGGRFATSDLNDLYRRVINRNNRLKRLMDLGAPEIILRNEKRMLQEAVDALIDNNHRSGRPILNSRGQPYKSLSDTLRGKQGRFRQNLLGKRVDYSGRAVIVAGPELSLYECGLPKVVALELFKPFVIREIIARGLSPNIKSAKNYLEEQSNEVWDILEEVIEDRPVLLNRAPTLHKQGIQAFFPVLTEGNAIRIHPMVCKGFNADFDGDQMAVHVPLSKKAVEEALRLMMPDSNLMLMSNGNPVINVNKDIGLGLFLLTKLEEPTEEDQKLKAFSSAEEALTAFDLERVTLNEKIQVVLNNQLVETCVGRIVFNQQLPDDMEFINEQVNMGRVGEIIAEVVTMSGKKEAIAILDYFKTIGFKYATLSGFSISMDDFVMLEKRDELLERAEAQVEKLNESYNNGLITNDERRSLSEEVWMRITEEISDLTWEEYTKRETVMALEESGTYPVKNPTRQISGIRGLILDPLGNIVELPLRSNYKLGLSPLEYFVAARGTRKGLSDTALKTSGSGYLTRKMIDVAHDVITREDDCGTKEGIVINAGQNRRMSFEKRITGRWTSKKVLDPKSKKTIIDADKEITPEMAKKIVKAGIEELEVRSPLKCAAEEGVCTKCYGYNLGTGELVEKGVAVGVIAAQAMGEAATQLTLDTRHLAGRAGTDITQGLPRVEELFEARIPKGRAILSELDGKVKVTENSEGQYELLTVSNVQEIEREYDVEKGDTVSVKKSGKVKKGATLMRKEDKSVIKAPIDGTVKLTKSKVKFSGTKIIEKEYDLHSDDELIVSDGDTVLKGQQLTVGSSDPEELMELKGLETAEEYIIDNIQETYGLQGMSIDDKHVEVVVRKMASFVTIDRPGDSDRLPGEYAHYYEIVAESERLKEQGKDPIKFTRRLLGITAASINTESFLSAASFQEVVRVLSDGALVGKMDNLRGLKENVIIGRPVPLGEYLR